MDNRITFNQIDQIHKSLKINRYSKISVRSITYKLLSQFMLDDGYHNLVLNAVKAYFYKKDILKSRSKSKPITDEELHEVYLSIPNTNTDNADIDIESETDEVHVNYYKSLLQVSAKQQYSRTAPIIKYLKEQAQINKVSVNELIGMVTKQLNYHSDRNSSILGEKLMMQGDCESTIVMSPEKSSYLQQHLQLGRTGYQLLKATLNDGNEQYKTHTKLPSWKRLCEYQKDIMPPILHDTSITGVRLDYISALKMSIKRILDLLIKTPISTDLKVHIKDGVDGSGSHAIYQQQNNSQTHNMIMFMFCVLRITDSGTERVIFEEKSTASPFSMRPVFIVLGKETLENLEDVKITVRERQNVPKFHVTTENGLNYKITVEADLSMIDAKMRSLLTGLGGAYCLLCTVDKDTACGRPSGSIPIDIESSCFVINRSYEETRYDYDRLSDDNGLVKRRRKDYADRKGLTQEPLVNEDLSTISPLHSLMRSYDFCQNLLYHLRSETFLWTDSALQLGNSYQSLIDAKNEVKTYSKRETGITMDAADPTGKGGNTNKGDICQRLMTNYRHVLVELVPERFQTDFEELLCRIWIVVKVYTSMDKVRINLFKEFCLETYNLILSKFNNVDLKWISITPTVHSLLAHGWELISFNDDKGLGEFTESGLENNKFLRFNRQNLSRKVNPSTNLEDCLTRMWLHSDPGIRDAAPKSVCSRCSSGSHYSVSCPEKISPEVQSSQTKDEYYLSMLLINRDK